MKKFKSGDKVNYVLHKGITGRKNGFYHGPHGDAVGRVKAVNKDGEATGRSLSVYGDIKEGWI